MAALAALISNPSNTLLYPECQATGGSKHINGILAALCETWLESDSEEEYIPDFNRKVSHDVPRGSAQHLTI